MRFLFGSHTNAGQWIIEVCADMQCFVLYTLLQCMLSTL